MLCLRGNLLRPEGNRLLCLRERADQPPVSEHALGTAEQLHRYSHHLTTRQNVSIENLLETDLVSTESVEEEYLRQEADKYALPKDYAVINEILGLLTEKQRGRYYKAKALNMSSRTIANEEGCDQSSVLESISGAEKKIQKELNKRGYR